jgi:hypothetical protein
MVLIYFEWVNIWLADNHIRVAATKFKFCLGISESSWNWESPREDSNGSNYVISVVIWVTCSCFLATSRGDDVLGANTWGSCSCLIDLPIPSDDPLVFIRIRRFMILT